MTGHKVEPGEGERRDIACQGEESACPEDQTGSGQKDKGSRIKRETSRHAAELLLSSDDHQGRDHKRQPDVSCEPRRLQAGPTPAFLLHLTTLRQREPSRIRRSAHSVYALERTTSGERSTGESELGERPSQFVDAVLHPNSDARRLPAITQRLTGVRVCTAWSRELRIIVIARRSAVPRDETVKCRSASDRFVEL